MKAYRLPGGPIVMQFPRTSGAKPKTTPLFTSAPLLNFYSQSISLNRVDYFASGPPLRRPLTPRMASVRTLPAWMRSCPLPELSHLPNSLSCSNSMAAFHPSAPGQKAHCPALESYSTKPQAPGLTRQTGYLEPSEGLRMTPALFNDHIRIDYLLQFQQFVAPADRAYSFRRLNGDFSHEIPLYKLLPAKAAALYTPTRSPALQYDGPDDCTGSGSNISVKHAGTPQTLRAHVR